MILPSGRLVAENPGTARLLDLGFRIAGDEAHPSVREEIVPNPRKKYEHFRLESHQEQDVQATPGQPAQKSTQFDIADGDDGLRGADWTPTARVPSAGEREAAAWPRRTIARAGPFRSRQILR
ncbi:hypothetical protein LCGC14_1870390 [marine sediment metagenome]|uniref:Uncharacterized protein n=1 Tax=marine sediment metagenome TaxID=412755 RepID=A0A0F9GTB0_9ZZZZ